MHAQTATTNHALLFGTLTLWLFGGSALLLSTLVPAHTDLLGWTPTFTLLLAPLIMLLALEPTLPRQLLALRRRRTTREPVWH